MNVEDRSEETWRVVDDSMCELLGLRDPALDRALTRSRDEGLPDIQVSTTQGVLLELLVRGLQARVVLEIGTLGGFSAICLARGMPEGGRLFSLELESKHAEVARANLRDAGLEDRAEVLVGPAQKTLDGMGPELPGPVDFVFLDADKTGYADYLAAVVPLCRPGAVIVADNVVWRGAVVDPQDKDPSTVGIRRFLDAVAAHPDLSSTVIQTVGTRGYDGFSISVVGGENRPDAS
jgi:predicted O-methyltransferase YrrM